MRRVNIAVTAIASVGLLASGCSGGSSPTAPIAPTSAGAPSARVERITLGGEGAGGTLSVGQKIQLAATAQLSDGSERDITLLATWDSEDPSVATVTPGGMVSAEGAGTGRIRAFYQAATGVTTFQVSKAAAPDGASSGEAPEDDEASAPPTAPSPSAPPPGGSPAPPPGGTPLPPTVQSLTIVGDNTVPVGRSAQLRAIATMSDGSQRDVTAGSDWKSSDNLIGFVSQSGVLTGVAPGSNVVTARYGGASASQPVQVTPL